MNLVNVTSLLYCCNYSLDKGLSIHLQLFKRETNASFARNLLQQVSKTTMKYTTETYLNSTHVALANIEMCRKMFT